MLRCRCRDGLQHGGTGQVRRPGLANVLVGGPAAAGVEQECKRRDRARPDPAASRVCDSKPTALQTLGSPHQLVWFQLPDGPGFCATGQDATKTTNPSASEPPVPATQSLIGTSWRLLRRGAAAQPARVP